MWYFFGYSHFFCTFVADYHARAFSVRNMKEETRCHGWQEEHERTN